VILRDGIKLALVGAPNVGKSSLLNRLTGDSRAIVTDIPGTTRDLIRADLNLDGLPVEIVDTAGLREAADVVEAEGVKRALAEASSADIVLVIEAAAETDGILIQAETDSAAPLPDAMALIETHNVIRVLNKIDLGGDELAARAEAAGYVPVSAQTGAGIDALRKAIRTRAGYAPMSNLFTARKRHLLALKDALARAGEARVLAAGSVPGELIAEELRAVHQSLGDIVGEMSSDALLGEIFSTFCIGK
jgi:tRNA modification GTPase